MSILLEPVSLGASGSIHVQFFLGRSRQPGRKILVAKYDGTCRTGDDGAADGRFMLAMGQAGLTAWEPGGFIVELTDLDCEELVDGLSSLLYVGEGMFGSENLPQAVVVGPRSEQAIRPFFDASNAQCKPEAMKEWYRDIAGAMAYIEKEVARLDSVFGKSRRPESP